MPKKVIAIDGPAGAGKSTVARLLAERLHYLYIDTGAMYRALTLQAMRLNISFTDEAGLTDLAGKTEIRLISRAGKTLVFCDGQDVTEKIRTPEVSQNVSLIALIPGVREKMVRLQRSLAQEGGVVMDGRDITTVVLPDADCKIFLTASVEERARRRCKELEAKGYPVSFAETKEDISRRDSLDMNRRVGPLMQDPDAVFLDSTGLAAEGVVDKILDLCGKDE